MCGIIGIAGRAPVTARLVEALRRLEYRGYDSAGIAVHDGRRLQRRRAEGKLDALVELLAREPVDGDIGIGHTRWATHGRASQRNAHPQMNDRVAVVHNGIIENFRTLRAELEAAGAVFESDTDTETIVHLLSRFRAEGMTPAEAVAAALKRLEGAFALGILFADAPDRLYAARRGSPLAIGLAPGESLLGSDALALAGLAERIIHLEEGDWAELGREKVRIFDALDRPVTRADRPLELGPALVGKGNYRHFMLKEIHEQPTVVAETLGSLIDPLAGRVRLPALPFDPARLQRLHIVSCGTSHHAGMVARYWIERLARLPVDADIASEFRYRDPVLREDEAVVVISQSGETADTLAAMRHAKQCGLPVIAIVNVPHSSIAREADAVIATHAGPEIGVASTKAFTCQLAVLAALAVGVARARGTLDEAGEAEAVEALSAVSVRLAEALRLDPEIEVMAHEVAKARDVLYLGRDRLYPLALEGALKLKEVSYI
ncbi:MAG: glutamine--fructose-6-phosphate transaminase (isomerizing), partial [Alphaproteobacteria bacterium]